MVRSTLTEYGTLVTAKAFEKIKESAYVLKVNAFKKTSQKIPIYMERYIDGEVYYQIPRGVCPVAHVTRDLPDELPELLDTPSLMGYQSVIVDGIVAELYAKKRFYLQMDTGLGKSFIAAGMISKMSLRACVVVSNKSLSRQMKNDLSKALPGADIEIYKNKSAGLKHATYNITADVTIIVINTAAKMPGSFFNNFGLVIYDEVHGYCTETFSKVFFAADCAMYVFGMTATPERLDGMQTVSFAHLGEPVAAFEMADGDEEMDAGNFFGTAVRVSYTGPKAFTKTIRNSNGIPSTILMAKQFLEDPFRMILVATMVLDLYRADRNIYIFCQTKDPLETLKKKVIKMMPEEERDIIRKQLYIVTGDSPEEIAAAANTKSRIFLTTYSLSGKGLSIPRFDTLILLTPMKSNMMQITGRIFRKKSDEKRRRLIIDIVDDRTFVSAQYNTRVNAYDTRQLEKKSTSIRYGQVGITKCMHEVLDCIDGWNVYGTEKRDEYPTIQSEAVAKLYDEYDSSSESED